MSDIKITRSVVDATLEKKLITYCITNTDFLKKIKEHCSVEHIKSAHGKAVYRWCCNYYDQYNEAPKGQITDLYMTYRSSLDDSVADTVAQFLSTISADNTEIDNFQFQFKQSIDYVRLRAVEVMESKLHEAVVNKDFTNAENIIAEFTKVKETKTLQ